MISIGPVEGLWLTVNAGTLLLTAAALVEAERDRRAVRRLNGKARRIATAGNVRREVLRTVVQVLLLLVAVPAIFSDREITLSPPIVELMTVAIVLLISSIWDARERRRLDAAVLQARPNLDGGR